MKYKIELTEPQIIWLEMVLGRGFDSHFENNPKERGFCDRIYDKVFKEIKKRDEDEK